MDAKIIREAETARTNGGFRIVRADGVSLGFYRTEAAAQRALQLVLAPTHYEAVCEDCGIETRLTARQADRFITTHVGAKHLATVQPVAR